MFDFEPHIKAMLQLQRNVTTHTSRAETAKSKLEVQRTSLVLAIKPACLSAIRTYNEDASPVIDTEAVSLNIDLKNMTIGMGVLLRDSNGCQLHEELDIGDTEKIDAALKPLLEAEFKNQGIPFTFSRIRVPNHYFTQ